MSLVLFLTLFCLGTAAVGLVVLNAPEIRDWAAERLTLNS